VAVHVIVDLALIEGVITARQNIGTQGK